MKLFDGVAGEVVAKVMAIANADMERDAIDALAPRAGDVALEVGFGLGVGVGLLARRLVDGRVAGIDPSVSMLRAAERRNRALIREGRVDLRLAASREMPFDDGSFDGAIAVNSVQLWTPLEKSCDELARVLRPGATFVALTHRWAAERHSSLDEWSERLREALLGRRFSEWRTWSGKARTGATVGLAVRREAG
jgi:ubiquinone/menaquinone biosynthesis C-methylase UbiE